MYIGASCVANEREVKTHALTFGWQTVTGRERFRQQLEVIERHFGLVTMDNPAFDSMAQLVPQAAEIRAWLLGAARVMPSLVLIPAFGMPALPSQARLGLAVTLGIAVAPALSHSSPLPLGFAVAAEMLRGLPVAINVTAALWAITMAGSLVDEFAALRIEAQLPIGPAAASPTSTLFTLIAAVGFLHTDGTARLVEALSRKVELPAHLLQGVVTNLISTVQIATSIAAPFIAASIGITVVSSWVSRSLNASSLQSLWSPLRALLLMLLLAALLDRVATAMGFVMVHAGI